MRQILVAAALSALLLLAGGWPSAAAMSLRIQLDGPAVVGVPARVTVTTVLPEQFCVDDPRSSPVSNGTWYTGGGTEPSDPAFRLIAHPADRPTAVTDIPLLKRAKDSPYWDGVIVFPSAGAWTLRMAEPHWGDPYSDAERCAGARVTVPVADGASTPSAQLVLAAGAALAVVAVALLVAVRRRRP